mmetsp:Transcript_109267/g.293303  ORF Transcript_109267/g.293303 Transcript_109267/m.293303 type:complete len:241 (+) Transcript_109267:77-799(+)
MYREAARPLLKSNKTCAHGGHQKSGRLRRWPPCSRAADLRDSAHPTLMGRAPPAAQHFGLRPRLLRQCCSKLAAVRQALRPRRIPLRELPFQWRPCNKAGHPVRSVLNQSAKPSTSAPHHLWATWQLFLAAASLSPTSAARPSKAPSSWTASLSAAQCSSTWLSDLNFMASTRACWRSSCLLIWPDEAVHSRAFKASGPRRADSSSETAFGFCWSRVPAGVDRAGAWTGAVLLWESRRRC